MIGIFVSDALAALSERGNIRCRTQYRLHARIFRRAGESDHAVHSAVVGDSQAIHSQLFRPVHKLLDAAHAIEEAIFGVNVEMSKHEPLELIKYSPYYTTPLVILSEGCGLYQIRLGLKLFVAEGLRRVYLRCLAGGQERHEKRSYISHGRDNECLHPGNLEFHASHLLLKGSDHAVGKSQCQRDSDEDSQEGYDGGFQEKAELHRALLITYRSQHPDLVSSLHHRSGADHPQGGDADYQTQGHETLQQSVPSPRA